jgi:hypothetical protein
MFKLMFKHMTYFSLLACTLPWVAGCIAEPVEDEDSIEGLSEAEQELLYTDPCPGGYQKIYVYQCEAGCPAGRAVQYAYCQGASGVYSVGPTGKTYCGCYD